MIGKILTFTGPEYSGRTTLILNTAYLLKIMGHSVLVLDADLTMGKIVTHLNLEKKDIGLAQAVTGIDESILMDCICKDKKTGLNILTLPGSANCNDLIELTKLQADTFYQKIRKRFEYILVDSGSILYEALTAASLKEAEHICHVIPQEKRGAVWLSATENVFTSLDISDPVYIISNLFEVPEISEEQLALGSKAKQIIMMPYVFNMREYTAAGEIFLKKPAGKKAGEYISGLEALIQMMKEV